jgi:hypothetical protein
MLVMVVLVTPAARAQTWNDPRTRALVELATMRRAEQLADTGLTAYQARAHGYVTFLAQLGSGFPAPPKILKADELELEVYWRAPNLSKQRIIGRRDTLLLPTDIQYHRDHLGIVQNNFPNIIRIGDGDEVADVPHPLSPAGLREYDFAITDSLRIGLPGRQIDVYEVKVRPKDDRQPRIVGAVYIDRSAGQVVRMAFNFTHAALLDTALEDLAVVLENRLVGTRFWLPSRQEIEIRRSGTWLDYPVRGIIRGRWEISQYNLNVEVPPARFAGPEIVQAPAEEQKRYPWKGAVLDSLPPDVRAVTDADVARVQVEARELVRSQALARARTSPVSLRGASDLVRYNRAEGLAVGDGISRQFGAGFDAVARARYGLDDHDVKGEASFGWRSGSGWSVRAFGMRDFRDVGDEPERSTALNSIAAQEFGSDYTDPYLVRGGGIAIERTSGGHTWLLAAGVEQHDSLHIHARSVVGSFAPTLAVVSQQYTRISLAFDRAPALWWAGTEMDAHVEVRGLVSNHTRHPPFDEDETAAKLTARLNVERPFGRHRWVLRTVGGFSATSLVDELVYLGGPVTAPGYDYHSLWSTAAVSQRVEWRTPGPFIPFSLGRFGRVPGASTLAPFVTMTYVGGAANYVSIGSPGPLGRPRPAAVRQIAAGYPSVGFGFLTPFDFLRMDVARGLRNGRWSFAIDVSREFWRIL